MMSSNSFNKELAITIGEVRDGINKLIKNGSLDETAKVLWVQNVSKGSCYELEEDVLPGSILIGLEWMEDGEPNRGTLRLEPPLITSQIN